MDPAVEAQKERDYLNHVAMGDFEAAAALRAEINASITAAATAEATEQIRLEGLRVKEAQAFNKAVADVIGDFPFLDDESDQADKSAIAECVQWRNFYIGKGMPPAAAIRKAAERAAEVRSAGSSGDDDGTGEADARSRRRFNPHVEEMDEEEFDSLTDAEKRELRGD